MLRSVKISLSFLTILRFDVDPPPDLVEVGKSAWAFPIVGILLGGILLAARWLVGDHVSLPLAAVLVVGLWIILTGGLHLDGWTDCCDALPTAVPPERRREILKDSRLGTFGALGLILLLSAKAAAIADEHTSLYTLFLAPVAGRAIMVMVCHNAVTTAHGMAAGFVSSLDRSTVRLAAVIGLGPVVLAGCTGITAVVVAFVVARGFRKFAESRLGTINGDVIGATCELSETIFLVIASMR